MAKSVLYLRELNKNNKKYQKKGNRNYKNSNNKNLIGNEKSSINDRKNLIKE